VFVVHDWCFGFLLGFLFLSFSFSLPSLSQPIHPSRRSVMSIRLLSSLRPALRLASANVTAAYRTVPRTAATSGILSYSPTPELLLVVESHPGEN